MKGLIDLHIHSGYSNDGEHSVPRIFKEAARLGIKVISITDHNCVGGVEEGIRESAEYGVRFIPGIEIDCNYKGTDLHLLGYGINWRSDVFRSLEKELEQKIMDKLPKMAENLARMGIPVDLEEVISRSAGKPPSAELFAEVLLENPVHAGNQKLQPYLPGGRRSDMPLINFYLDYFAQGKPAHVPTEYMDFSEAVRLVRRQKGIPVIAHPGLNFREREGTVAELLDHGAEGLEVFNNYHSPEQTRYFAGLVNGRKALMTCGSDFHGKTKPRISLGSYFFMDEYAEEVEKSTDLLYEAC
jgi:predicted metal-dependent phosphoesterase TrpH